MSRASGYGRGAPNIDQAPVPTKQNGVPTSNTAFDFGQLILNSATGNWYLYAGASVFTQLTSSSGPIFSITGTANQITATTVSQATTLSIPSTFIAPGSVAATTSLTATLGNVTATNGNLVLGTLGNKVVIPVGTNASLGTSAAMTTGTITVSTSAVTASSKIFLTTNVTGGTIGTLYLGTVTAGTSFVINSSSATDTSSVNWWIID